MKIIQKSYIKFPYIYFFTPKEPLVGKDVLILEASPSQEVVPLWMRDLLVAETST